MNDPDLRRLEQRLGAVYARQRLGIEIDHEAQIFGQGLNFFHPENWYATPSLIRAALKVTGLYWRGCRNAARVQVRHNDLRFARLPDAFDGFTLLHISDPHVEMNDGAMRRVKELLPDLSYDACVLTGDYRAATVGPFDQALTGLAAVCAHIKGPIYGVLGNHDTIRMVPGLEDIGIRMLLNECAVIARGDQRIYLAGIDDAHFFRVDNIEKAASEIPGGAFSILSVPHPGNLPAGGTCGVRAHSERAHPWRSALPAGSDPDHARFDSAAPDGRRRLDLQHDGGLHLGWAWIIDRGRPHQLSAGNHAALSAPCVI